MSDTKSKSGDLAQIQQKLDHLTEMVDVIGQGIAGFVRLQIENSPLGQSFSELLSEVSKEIEEDDAWENGELEGFSLVKSHILVYREKQSYQLKCLYCEAEILNHHKNSYTETLEWFSIEHAKCKQETA